MGRGPWVGRAVLAALLIAGACAQKAQNDPFASYDPSDPFDDPFFNEEFEAPDSLDEVAHGRAPSAGWLAAPGEDNDARLLEEHADPFWGEGDESGEGDPFAPQSQKSFSEKAQEATLATMSVLVGAGMAALPYLIGAL